LALDIVRSDEEAISTAARAKVLELLYNFDIGSVAAAFSAYSKGFLLHERVFVEDLIPNRLSSMWRKRGEHLIMISSPGIPQSRVYSACDLYMAKSISMLDYLHYFTTTKVRLCRSY
jgi:hypothetical protein